MYSKMLFVISQTRPLLQVQSYIVHYVYPDTELWWGKILVNLANWMSFVNILPNQIYLHLFCKTLNFQVKICMCMSRELRCKDHNISVPWSRSRNKIYQILQTKHLYICDNLKWHLLLKACILLSITLMTFQIINCGLVHHWAPF